jgi:hypothetical protein
VASRGLLVMYRFATAPRSGFMKQADPQFGLLKSQLLWLLGSFLASCLRHHVPIGNDAEIGMSLLHEFRIHALRGPDPRCTEVGWSV